MGNVGISDYLANSWLNTLGGAPFFVPTCYFQVFVGVPGADGTANQADVTDRVAATFAPAVNGAFNFTGLPPIWPMTSGEQISHVGAFDGPGVDANFLFSGVALKPRVVANGDKLVLGGFAMSFLKRATD